MVVLTLLRTQLANYESSYAIPHGVKAPYSRRIRARLITNFGSYPLRGGSG